MQDMVIDIYSALFRFYIYNEIYSYCLIVDHDPTYNCMNLLRTGLLQCKYDHDHWHWRPLEAGWPLEEVITGESLVHVQGVPNHSWSWGGAGGGAHCWCWSVRPPSALTRALGCR